MKTKLLLTICTAAGMALVGSAWAQNVSKTVTTNAIKIEDAYTRATVPGQQVAGGFMKIENKGAADQLLSASSPVAG